MNLNFRLLLKEALKEKVQTPDTKYTPPAPVLTEIQRTLIGLVHKLETSCFPQITETIMLQTEKYLLFHAKLQHISPLTRLYLAICKQKKLLDRMRRTVCDAFYFMDDLAVPFFFIVLSTWLEVLPMASECEGIYVYVQFIKCCDLKKLWA